MSKTQLAELIIYLESTLESSSIRETAYAKGYSDAVKDTLAVIKSLIAWN